MGLVIAACGVIIWLQVSALLHKRAHAKTRPVVCIDAGHPSETNSARILQHGTYELEMNWVMAGKLRDALEAKGIEVVMTKRSRDQFVQNHTRAFIANECEADLAVHLHCDAGPGRGYTIYYPNRQGNLEGYTGPAQEVIDSSRRAAYTLHSGMSAILTGSLHDRGVKGDDKTKIGRSQGTLTTSCFSEVPTVTIEMCFLNNLHDNRFIQSPAGQSRLTRALANGIAAYLLANGYVQKSGRLILRASAE
jgi:N-acetylmuramoyl-L-alanine amidase